MKIVRVSLSVLIIMALLRILDSQVYLRLAGERIPNSSLLGITHAQTNVPSARYGASMAFDSKRNKIVLFGGCQGDCSNGSNKSNETWEFDGATWTKITTVHSPTPRLWAGMVYDTQREVIVLFGGYQLNDTWEYDGTDWTQITTQNRPSARTAVDLAYDSGRQVVILSSGHQPTYCNVGTNFTDVWEYDGTNWTARINSGGPLNELPGIAYDPIRQKTIHFVGRHNCNLYSQTWAYDGTTISQLSPSTSPPPTSGPIRFDTALAKIALFGGCTGSNSSRCTQYSNDIWTFNGTTWSILNITNKPPGRYFHSITYDTTRQRLVTFGGCADYYWGLRCTNVLDDLWEFDGTQWKKFDSLQSTLDCSEPQVYYGITHCRDIHDKAQMIVVDLNDSHVSIRTVLSSRNGIECNSVNHNDPSKDPTSNCDPLYPVETMEDMLIRYREQEPYRNVRPGKEAVAIINTDYFALDWDHGAQGLAVQDGNRLDGLAHGDDDAGGFLGSTKPSLAISISKSAKIGIPKTEQETIEEAEQKINILTDTVYYNTVGGAPIIVTDSIAIGNSACSSTEYPYLTCHQEQQSAAGLTNDGHLVLITARKDASGVAEYLTKDYTTKFEGSQVHTALKFDGSHSASMAWVDGYGKVITYYTGIERAVAEGLLIFSSRICPVEVALNQNGSTTTQFYASNVGDLISQYRQLRDEVLLVSEAGQRYIEDYDNYGPEASLILLTDSDLRTRTAQFLENAAPAFGSLLPNSTQDVVLTQALYDEANDLVQDLANASSSELHDKMLQTWEDMALDEHIGEIATEIWQQMQEHIVYLPIILK